MLVLALSYAQKTGDKSVIWATYPLFTQWTGCLVNDSLIPANQISTDDFEGALANQTNLAIKGMIGIRAMGEITTMLARSAMPVSIASNYATKMLSYVLSPAPAIICKSTPIQDCWKNNHLALLHTGKILLGA